MQPVTKSLPLDQIIVEGRLRDVDEAWAAAIAAGFEERGQLQPIVVRPKGQKFQLVAGAHRMRAAALAGWSEISAIIKPMNDLEARIEEIDENLMRRELGALDRAIFLAERKAAWEKLHPATKHGGNRKPLKDGEDIKSPTWRLEGRFTSEVQNRTGISERTVQRAVSLLEGIAPDAIPLLRQTTLADNAAQIRLLATEPPKDQLKILKAIIAGEARNIRQARAFAGLASPAETSPTQKEYEALVRAWERAGSRARKQFLRDNDLQYIPDADSKAA